MSSEAVNLTSVCSLPMPPFSSCVNLLSIFLGVQQIDSVVSKNNYVFNHSMHHSGLILSDCFLVLLFRIST